MSNALASPRETASQPPVGQWPAHLPLLTDKQERFCLALMETGNQSMAYKAAYETTTSNRQTIHNEASKVANTPQVQYRIDQLKEAAAQQSVASKARLVDFLWRRINANRAQLLTHVQLCCRHCYGVDHLYQWKDELEYAQACVSAAAAGQNMPSADGGFGFSPHLPPAATCNVAPCLGFGSGRTVVTDTTQLQGDAALIYEGVKETDKGPEIKVADRNADMALFLKLTGWGTEELEGMLRGAAAGGAAGAVAAQAVVEKVKGMNSDDTRRAYLTMIGGA